MKTLLWCIITLLFSAQLYSHELETHEYIVKESWKLLKMSFPEYNDIEMNNWIGTDQHDGPWSNRNQGRVVAGAWREDDEDPIWNYQCFQQYTVTHFWDVDKVPDFWPNIGVPQCLTGWDCGDFPNAYLKMTAYQQGGWHLKRDFTLYGSDLTVRFDRFDGNGYIYVTSYGPIGFKYQGLTEGPNNLYNTGYMEIVGYTNSAGIYVDVPYTLPPIKTQLNKYYCYEILGRMCHLIGDMGVPAHLHIDTHPAPCGVGDSYEIRMKHYFQNYTANNANGNFINSFYKPLPPLRYLMTIMGQVSDMFPSNDAEGDNNWPLYPDMPNYQNLDITSSIFTGYGENGVSQQNFEKIADYCMRYNLRTTAGLMHWFVVTSGQKAPKIDYITYNLPDKHINIGETGVFTAYPNDPGCTYTWERVNCTDEVICQDQIPGVVENRNGNQYRITNNTYPGISCQTYTASCGPGKVTDFIPTGLDFYIKVIARNATGEATKYFSFDNKISPTTDPRYPGGVGCPFIYVQNDSGQFISDNNILHRSEFAENVGMDISDKYLLNVKPGVFDEKIKLNLFETTHDISSINSIKLLAVDHPAGTKIGVTENNDIVMYYTDDTESPKNASKNHIEDITRYIQYTNGNGDRRDTTVGLEDDNVVSDFEIPSLRSKLERSKNKFRILGRGGLDSTALIMRIGMNPDLDRPPVIIPAPKDHAGSISISSDVNSLTTDFARREYPSDVIIPFGQNTSIEKADIQWNRDYQLLYAAVVDVFYSGFDVTELPLTAALSSSNTDLISALQNVDGDYATLDSSGIIMLEFNNAANNSGMIRDYIIQTDGQYSAPSANRLSANLRNNSTSKEKETTVGLTNKLSANYPNPFNPVTKINYEIKREGFVSLKIYNVVGQLVKELVGEFKNAGSYIVEFNGSALASGTYYYRIESGDFVETKKMILIK